MNLNKILIAGNVTRDPELRFTPKGTAVCKIGLALNRKWKSESGESKEEVTFVDVDFFGKTAENVGQYFKKGSPIFVEGRLKFEQWDDKQTGQKRSRLGVCGESFQFVGKKGETSEPEPRMSQPSQAAPAQPDPMDFSEPPF
jgi:single-strand DNA-binding protein